MVDSKLEVSSDSMYRELFMFAPEALVFLSPEGRISKVNSRAEEMLGKREVVKGNYLIDFMDREQAEELIANLVSVKKTKETLSWKTSLTPENLDRLLSVTLSVSPLNSWETEQDKRMEHRGFVVSIHNNKFPRPSSQFSEGDLSLLRRTDMPLKRTLIWMKC